MYSPLPKLLLRRECGSGALQQLQGVLGVHSPVNCLGRKSLLQYSFRILVKRLKTFVSICRSVIKLFTLSYILDSRTRARIRSGLERTGRWRASMAPSSWSSLSVLLLRERDDDGRSSGSG